LLTQFACSDLTNIQDKEWIITNGTVGYASSTVADMNTRQYHGLLVAPVSLKFLLILDPLEINGHDFGI
jgi:glycogen debranching enzyme